MIFEWFSKHSEVIIDNRMLFQFLLDFISIYITIKIKSARLSESNLTDQMERNKCKKNEKNAKKS